MLRNVYLRTLRSFWIPILGWGLGMGVTVAYTMTAIGTLVTTPQAKAELVTLARSYAWNADPVRVDTPGGYATFKAGVFMLLICLWPILAASRTLRGEEERGSLDPLLCNPVSRLTIALEKAAATFTALLAIGALIGLIADASGAKVGAGLGLAGGLAFGLNLALQAAVFGAIALLISQFTQERRTAAGWTSGLLVVAIVVDMVHRVVPGSDWFSKLSPVYYYNLSKPLVPGYGLNGGGLAVQALLVLVIGGAAVWLFLRRDVGGVVPLPRLLAGLRSSRPASSELPRQDWSLRSVYLRALRASAAPTAWWCLGIAGFGAWMVFVVEQVGNQLKDIMNSSPQFRQLILSIGGADPAKTNDALLSAIFVFMPLALMAYAVTQVNRWKSDEEDGRLDLVLAAQQPRVQVILGRFAGLATGTIAISLVCFLATAAASAASATTLSADNLAGAALGMIPMALLVAGIGYLGAGWLTTAADTGLLSLLLFGWFFVNLIGPDLKWPEGVLRLSPFYYYGRPLVDGLSFSSVLLLVGVGVVTLALGVVRFQRKDIAV